MTSPLSFDMATALKNRAPIALLAEIEHPDGIGRFWTGVGNLVIPATEIQYGLISYVYTFPTSDEALFQTFRGTWVDSTVNFNPADTTLGTNRAGQDNLFTVRWVGYVRADFTENYTFYTTNDDGARLYINNILVIDSWVDQSPTEHSGSINLIANTWYPLVLEYYENGGGAVITMSYSSPSVAKTIIPATNLALDLGTDAVTFTGVGKLGGVSPVKHNAELSIQDISFTLVGVDQAIVSQLSDNVRNLTGRVWLVCLNERQEIVGDPYLLVDAQLDYQSFSIDESGNAAIIITARMGFYTLERAVNESWTPEDRRLNFPGDVGFDYIPQLINQEIQWIPS